MTTSSEQDNKVILAATTIITPIITIITTIITIITTITTTIITIITTISPPKRSPYILWSMDLKGAQEAFLAVLQQLPQPETRKAFLAWVDDTWIRGEPPNLMVCPPPCLPPPMTSACPSDYSSGDTKLRKIADDLRELMPLNAILPTEQISFPSVGEAYIYTKCQRIVGVEINPELCQVQQTIINKYQFQDRLQVVAGDIQDHGEVVRVADIICLNNVFEFFMPPTVQARIWAFLRANIKKGALLVTIPALEDSLQYLDCGFRLQEWAREVPPHDPNITAPFDFQSETSEVKLYQVI
ncbi:hypothetical protein GWK47_037202 [Chionoecetes opilio]|uniref:Uncharacterized protein n=1 Tax=Chionoecetes opilio TaxID=41210 RepID=A0A8J4YQ55_CHIOP|nr:hypothetical protein GWK47_037202 [Chionoecetes opilio]